MARKITMFELYFDGVQFGGAAEQSPADADEGAEAVEDLETADESGRSFGRLVLGMVVTGVLVSFVASRIARRVARDESDTDTDVEVEGVEESESAIAQ